MSALISNQTVNLVKRGLTIASGRVMSALVSNLRTKLIGAILAGVLAPQAAVAGGNGRSGMSHGGGRSGSGSAMKSMQRSMGSSKSFSPKSNSQKSNVSKNVIQKSQKSPSSFVNRNFDGKNSSKPSIATKNGNTGVAGAGQPKPKFSKSELLAKYGVQTGGTWNTMGTKTPGLPANPSKPSEPKHDNHAKHDGSWHYHGFPWVWPIFPPVASHPGCQVVVTQPTPVYVETPVAVVEAPVAETPVVEAQPAEALPVQGTPLDVQPAAGVVARSVDLVLEDVHFVEPATLTAGPVYRVKFRNQGTQAAGKFRVGAFAESGGELNDDAPQAVTEVASLAAGEASEVTLQLPVAVVRLVSTSAPQSAFDQLLVVIDLDDSVVESQKSNNVANLERTQLEATAR